MFRIGVDVGGTNTDAVLMQGKEVVDGYKSTTCKPPCQKYVFETDKLYEIKDESYENEVRIVFARKVEHTKTYFLQI